MPAPVLQFKRGNAGVAGTVPALRPGEPAISLNNFDFFIGIDTSVANNKFFGSHRYWEREDGTSALKLKLVDKDGTNSINLKSPDTLAGIVTYTLPETINDGYFLKTNSTGNLTWAEVVSNINIAADTGTPDNVSTGATITFAGGTNVNTAVTNDTITINLDDNINVSGVATVGSFISNNGGSFNGNVQINSNLNVNGNVTVGGTTISLRGEDVFIENKDIILGYTTSITPNDDTANHAGIAIASTEGTPLTSFSATGINTLPDTYKQLMWFKSGTLGFSTDVFAFNYGVAIGTTTMANGVRLAVGPNVTVTDTTVTATTFSGALSGNASSADQVKTVTASDNNANYYVTFVDANNGSATNESVYTDDGIYYNPGANKLTTQHAEFTGNVLVSGITTLAGNVNLGDSGSDLITVVGVTTFTTSNVYIDNQLYVSGIQVTGGASVVGEDITARNINLSGIATVTGLIDGNGGANISGGETILSSATVSDLTSGRVVLAGTSGSLEDSANLTFGSGGLVVGTGGINVTGVSTFSTDLVVGGDIRVNGNDIKASDGTTALTLSATSGNVKTGGDLIAGSGYLASPNGTRSLYMYDTSGDVSFQGKAIVNEIRSSNNASALITLNDLDATFARNVLIAGITTTSQLKVGTGVGITQFSGSVSTGTSTSSVPTSSAVIDYVGTQVGNIDLTTSIAGDTGTGSVSTSQTFTIAGTANEVETSASGQTITVGLPDAVVVGTSLSSPTVRTNIIQSQNTGATAITITANDVTVADDLTVQGNLYVQGSTTQIDTQTLTVEDRTIQLGMVDGVAPTSATTWDLGVLFNYYTDSAKQSAVVWEHADARFKFGSVISDGGGTGNNNPQITVSTFAPIEVSALWVTDCAGTSQVISCTGSTRYLENITVDAGTF